MESGGNFLHFFHGDGALALQGFDYVGVVDYLMLDINGWLELLETEFHDFYGANYTGAEPPGANSG